VLLENAENMRMMLELLFMPASKLGDHVIKNILELFIFSLDIGIMKKKLKNMKLNKAALISLKSKIDSASSSRFVISRKMC
jgi:hypothetical protein